MDPAPGLSRTLLGENGDDGALVPPIHQTVPFVAADARAFDEMNRLPLQERTYRRYGNPTQSRVEAVVAALEGAEAALATGSGMGAISLALLTFLEAGDHVVAQRSMYGGSLAFLRRMAPRLGIDAVYVDQTDVAAFERALTPRTKLIVLETPSNPLLTLTDLTAVAALARERGVMTLVDNTIATPVDQRPIDHGIDLVVHSMTKSLSGHSDVLAGIVAGRRDVVEELWSTHILLGSVIAPFDAWLTLRGLRTLALRVRWQDDLALAAARRLEAHEEVLVVHYPGLETHPQHGLARTQMRGYGSVLSFEVRGGGEGAERVLSKLRVAARASSLGGFRSLAVQPAAMWRGPLDETQLAEAGVPPGLIRLSVGLEDEADLVEDLERALSR